MEKLGRSVKLHIAKIKESNAISVLDLGCGAGGILLALQKEGIEGIYGIDASPEAIEMAKKRFEKYGILEKTAFTVGNITQFDPPVVDAVSCHAVLCCFPNASGIIDKATEKDPKLVVITFPRDKFRIKVFMSIFNTVLRFVGLFRSSIRGRKTYVHSTKMVDQIFRQNGYNQVFTEIGSIMQTLVYEKVK